MLNLCCCISSSAFSGGFNKTSASKNKFCGGNLCQFCPRMRWHELWRQGSLASQFYTRTSLVGKYWHLQYVKCHWHIGSYHWFGSKGTPACSCKETPELLPVPLLLQSPAPHSMPFQGVSSLDTLFPISFRLNISHGGVLLMSNALVAGFLRSVGTMHNFSTWVFPSPHLLRCHQYGWWKSVCRG